MISKAKHNETITEIETPDEALPVFYCPELDMRVEAANEDEAIKIFKRLIKEGK